jgi:hypothetical protein
VDSAKLPVVGDVRPSQLLVMENHIGNSWWRQRDLDADNVTRSTLHPAPETSKFARQWAIVKGARFNAAKRYEGKHTASTLALAVAGFAGVLVPVYPMIFTEITAHLARVLDFTSLMIGALSSTLGLYDLSKNLPERARQFHECGKAINRQVRRLEQVTTHTALAQLVEEYERAIDACPDNHDSIDYDISKAQWDLKSAKPAQARTLRRSCCGCALGNGSGLTASTSRSGSFPS